MPSFKLVSIELAVKETDFDHALEVFGNTDRGTVVRLGRILPSLWPDEVSAIMSGYCKAYNLRQWKDYTGKVFKGAWVSADHSRDRVTAFQEALEAVKKFQLDKPGAFTNGYQKAIDILQAKALAVSLEEAGIGEPE